MCRIFVVSCVQKEEKWRFLKDALWGGGGVPTGAGLVDGGSTKGLDSRGRGQGRVGLLGQGSGAGLVDGGSERRGKGSGGVQGLRFRGVGGRDTGPRDGANFATCVIFLSFPTHTKRRFFEGCPVGCPLVDGGVDQGPWLQERVGGGGGLVGCSKQEQVQVRG